MNDRCSLDSVCFIYGFFGRQSNQIFSLYHILFKTENQDCKILQKGCKLLQFVYNKQKYQGNILFFISLSVRRLCFTLTLSDNLTTKYVRNISISHMLVLSTSLRLIDIFPTVNNMHSQDNFVLKDNFQFISSYKYGLVSMGRGICLA